MPDGSAVTTLTGANTMTPSFVPDITGDYVVQLVVTDEDGLPSLPSQVTIGENLPPTASIEPDQLAMVNQPVALNGAAIDPDGDLIVYSWQFTAKPAGSHAEFANPSESSTFFFPDLPGVYVATLTPSDSVGPGTAASTTVTVTTGTIYAQIQLQAVAAQVQDLPPGAVTTKGNLNAFIHLLSNAVVAVQNGDLDEAREKLAQAISRTDGCALQGSPDGNGPGRDWITVCSVQEHVYPPLIVALFAILP